jgi:hypothetical protein
VTPRFWSITIGVDDLERALEPGNGSERLTWSYNAGTLMTDGWIGMAFGSGTWKLWYGSLFLAFLMLLGTGIYACLEPEGPGAGPMLMLMVFVLAFVTILVVTSVDVGLFARSTGSGFMRIVLFVVATWMVVGLSWTFLFWATDPNSPHLLFPGRILFIAHSVMLYTANLWLLWRIRQR